MRPRLWVSNHVCSRPLTRVAPAASRANWHSQTCGSTQAASRKVRVLRRTHLLPPFPYVHTIGDLARQIVGSSQVSPGVHTITHLLLACPPRAQGQQRRGRELLYRFMVRCGAPQNPANATGAADSWDCELPAVLQLQQEGWELLSEGAAGLDHCCWALHCAQTAAELTLPTCLHIMPTAAYSGAPTTLDRAHHG